MSLEDDLRNAREDIRALRSDVADLTALVRALRAEIKPKILRRAQLAEAFGHNAEWLRKTLSRGSKGESELGRKLLELARRLGDEQVWYPDDIRAHCGKWLASAGGGE